MYVYGCFSRDTQTMAYPIPPERSRDTHEPIVRSINDPELLAPFEACRVKLRQSVPGDVQRGEFRANIQSDKARYSSPPKLYRLHVGKWLLAYMLKSTRADDNCTHHLYNTGYDRTWASRCARYSCRQTTAALTRIVAAKLPPVR